MKIGGPLKARRCAECVRRELEVSNERIIVTRRVREAQALPTPDRLRRLDEAKAALARTRATLADHQSRCER